MIYDAPEFTFSFIAGLVVANQNYQQKKDPWEAFIRGAAVFFGALVLTKVLKAL